MLNSLDESLIQQKDLIINQLQTKPPENFTSFNQSISITETADPAASEILSSQDIFIDSDSEIVTHRVLEAVATINGKNYAISLRKSLIENEDLIQTIVAIQVGLIILLFAGLFFINRQLSRAIWQPFYGTLRRLQSFRINENKALDLPRSNINEFNELNHSLRQLGSNAISLFNAQKEFTENASHELQTPIAIIQGKLELLMQANPLSQEQALLIGTAYDAGQRMSRLNKSLLLMSKLENNQFLLTDEIDLAQNVQALVILYQDVALQKGIGLVFEAGNTSIIKGNKSLFDTMVGNLLNNALVHSKSNSKVLIKLNDGQINICNPATNNGLDEGKLFNRFQKQSGSEHGTGLGLEIAAKIADVHSGHITYNYLNNTHSFTIYLSIIS